MFYVFCLFTPLFRRFRLSRVWHAQECEEIYRLVSKILNFIACGSVFDRFCVCVYACMRVCAYAGITKYITQKYDKIKTRMFIKAWNSGAAPTMQFKILQGRSGRRLFYKPAFGKWVWGWGDDIYKPEVAFNESQRTSKRIHENLRKSTISGNLCPRYPP